MSLESIVAFVGAALLPVLGYFLKTVIEDVKELRHDLSEFKATSLTATNLLRIY